MKQARWAIINTLFGVLMFFALHENNENAQSLLMFASWITIVCSFAFYSDDAIKSILSKKDNFGNVPKAVNTAYDITVCCIFAWYGWLWTAIFWFIHWINTEVGRDKFMKLSKPSSDSA